MQRGYSVRLWWWLWWWLQGWLQGWLLLLFFKSYLNFRALSPYYLGIIYLIE
jgi:hypothetical protein